MVESVNSVGALLMRATTEVNLFLAEIMRC